MATIDRELAMLWWSGLSWTDKGLLMEGEFEHRHPQSLTGREIEMLWKKMMHSMIGIDDRTNPNDITTTGEPLPEGFPPLNESII